MLPPTNRTLSFFRDARHEHAVVMMVVRLLVPSDPEFTLVEQPPEEQAQRKVRAQRIHASRNALGKDST